MIPLFGCPITAGNTADLTLIIIHRGIMQITLVIPDSYTILTGLFSQMRGFSAVNPAAENLTPGFGDLDELFQPVGGDVVMARAEIATDLREAFPLQGMPEFVDSGEHQRALDAIP